MTHTEIHARLDELTAIARSRQLASDGMFAATVGGAEIDWMTADEREERHQLMLELPTFAELREAARARIQARIGERRSRRQAVQNQG